MSKEVELKAEAKVLGQPRVLQIHERQAMLRAVEAIHGVLGDFRMSFTGLPCDQGRGKLNATNLQQHPLMRF